MAQEEEMRGGDGGGDGGQKYAPGPSRPAYMNVGSGSTSATAAALIAAMDHDSGYGSMNDGIDSSDKEIIASLNADLPMPSTNERDSTSSHIHQLRYNHNRVLLNRAISETIDRLKGLQAMNQTWPAHYPSIQGPPSADNERSRAERRPALHHTQSNMVDVESTRPRPGARRAFTTQDLAGPMSPTSPTTDRPPQSLITADVAQQFSILKIDLKLDGLTQEEFMNSQNKKSIASLLDGRINQSVRHLLSLRERIEDTSSKVLVTGDLNAGKSTFCNALLRRKVLPEDQQPCTAIFCEVIDARENSGLEEVHAILRNRDYDRNDESTYDVFPLNKLEEVVINDQKYVSCKVYVKDTRSIDQSLLNNGVVDIALIDAPGLNADSVTTTALFARQQEIDVVVFVVSAPNHFTQSAKEFLWKAAQEKAYLFVVVNGYDNIRDKERCQRSILEQVARLSPRTFKESTELVHFVSSNAVPTNPGIPVGGPGGGGSSSSSGGGGGSGGFGGGSGPGGDPHDDDGDASSTDKHGDPGSSPDGKGKGKEKEKIEDFEHLESSLRRFILEKRARSKLAPARTYLMNILSDVNALATVNRDVAENELNRVAHELEELEPQYKSSQRATAEAETELDNENQLRCEQVRSATRARLNQSISNVASQELGVEYPGLMGAFQFAEDIKDAILDQIADAVSQCEEAARNVAKTRVEEIQLKSKAYLGDDHKEMGFRSEMMFSKRRHDIARHADVQVEVGDFFDLSGLWERQEKVAGTSMAVTVIGVLGTRLVGGVGWVDGALGAIKIIGVNNTRKLAVPGLVAAVALTAAYVLSTIPTSLPQRLSKRIAGALAADDYTQRNSERIAREVASVLRVPSRTLSLGLQHSMEKLRQKREDTLKIQRESETARKYFINLVRDSAASKQNVEAMDLEAAPAPLMA